MQVISSFFACNDGCRVGKTRLLHDGAALPGMVSGVVIEAQFRLADDSALIWLTDDCAYEEGLYIYLLSPAGQILDQVIGGARYTPAFLKIVETGDAHVDFKFFGVNEVMRLSVGDPRRRRIHQAGYRYGGWRWSRRLSLQPSPDRPAKLP